LNALSEYSSDQLNRWNSSANSSASDGRVLVTANRVAVARATGSILFAHMRNFQQLAWR
jgi:hypothetical protein